MKVVFILAIKMQKLPGKAIRLLFIYKIILTESHFK